MTITIEKGIPMNDYRGRYKFFLLEVGDSFSFTHEEKECVQNSASLYKRRHPGWNYKTKWQSDGVYRLWRIA